MSVSVSPDRRYISDGQLFAELVSDVYVSVSVSRDRRYISDGQLFAELVSDVYECLCLYLRTGGTSLTVSCSPSWSLMCMCVCACISVQAVHL